MRKILNTLYLYQKPHWGRVQGIIDFFGFFLRPSKDKKIPDDIKKILISRIDHLGDVFLASSVLPHLKKAHPHAEIHFLAGEWAEAYLRNNQYVDKILIYSSFKHNRTGGFFHKVLKAVSDFICTILVMRKQMYDLSVDLRAYPFNSIVLMYMGNIKFKVGFATGGFGFLLDRIIPYRINVHEVEHLQDALKQLGIVVEKGDIRPFYLIPDNADRKAEAVLCDAGLLYKESFILVHTGSGKPQKQWKGERWQELIEHINKNYGIRVVAYDDDNILTSCLKLPPKLPLDLFASIARKAVLFIGHDSFPAHLAAAVDTPLVVIWCGINNHVQWRPLGNRTYLVRRELECSPCYKKNGCPTMDCMEISVGDVVKGVAVLLSGSGSTKKIATELSVGSIL